MRKLFCFTMLVTASFLMACAPAANNGNAAKPANAANTASTANANTGANAAAIDSEIKKAVTDMADSLQKGDAAYFEKLYTENYMFVGPDGGVATGAERVASMKSGGTKYESIKYDDVRVRSNPEGNGAISISRATVKGVNLGKAVDGQFRVTHVWSKTKDGWRLASGHTTPITGAASSADKTSNSADKAPSSADKLSSSDAAPTKTTNSSGNK